MAGLALRRELSVVPVGVTGDAFPAQAKVRAVTAICRGYRCRLAGDVRGLVTIPAFQCGMTFHQDVAGLTVIEVLFRRIPVNQAEIPAVVIGMASRARALALVRTHQNLMPSDSLIQTSPDLPMAIETLVDGRPAAQFMAADTVSRPIERAVGV